MSGRPKRQAVPEEQTWDLTTIFANDSAWEAAFTQVTDAQSAVGALQGTLAVSADALAAGIGQVLDLYRALEKVYVYASLKSDQDIADAKYQGFVARADSLLATVSAQAAFLEPEILAIPAATLKTWLQTEALAGYRHFIDAITKKRAHVLDTAQESLLSAAGDALGTSRATFNVLNNAELEFGFIEDEDGQAVQLSHGLYGELIKSQTRAVRRSAFETLYAAYDDLKGTFASTLSGEIKRHNFNAQAHHYPSARAAALAANDIPESVYTTLVTSVNDHLTQLHRYVDLRQHQLALDELHMYDLYVPLTGEPPLKYTIEMAKEEALKALAPLGQDYLSHVQALFDQRMIDVVENQNKRAGAYSGGAYDTNPFILLNWQDSIDALYTLVHEVGHSVHSWYTRHHQPYVYGDYSIFVAEIASTTNENLLTDYLLHTQSDPQVRAYVLNYYLDGFKGTVFRQTQFAEFEDWLHTQDAAHQPLTAQVLNDYYQALNARYYGPQVAKDPEIALEWARIPHFYMNYYVYQYATGFAAASTLADGITQGAPEALTAYLNYLQSGSSQYPIETMQQAGVDMTQGDYLAHAFTRFDQRLEELARLMA